jgi:3-mercaptopyruvate sulfurtransferase SseA
MRARAHFWVLLVGLAAVLAGGCERTTRDTDIRLISASQVKLLLDRSAREPSALVLIDPRPASYFERERLPGARNIELPRIDPKGSTDPSISRFGTIVVYGDNPGSAVARAMTKRLMAVGYDGVRFFAGGVDQWKTMRFPLEGRGLDDVHPPDGPVPTAPPEPAAANPG